MFKMASSIIRQPIISVLGHVDHGKTTLLDYIRGTVVASREVGLITQHIGATDVPFDTIKKVCGNLLDKLKLKVDITGLLFIDTPGHEAFTTLRKRGGSVADLAILVVDINDGLMPQTIEAIQILRQYKTPFVVAANKIDAITGYRTGIKIDEQIDRVKDEFYKKFYSLLAQLSEQGFDSNLYSQVTDFRKQLAIVPISAKTGEGIPELLMILMGLAQQYLGDRLAIEPNNPGRGTILEVKEERGLGTTIDVILYDGRIRRDDPIVVGAREPIVTKVKALLKPRPLDEMRDPRYRSQNVNEIYAASGIKIVAPNLENALAGAPIYVGSNELVDKIREEIGEIEFTKENLGVIVVADTLGSLEAMVKLLAQNGIPIRKGSIGKVSKRDTIEAYTVNQEDTYLGVVLAFNTSVLEDAMTYASDHGVKIFSERVIYRLIEDYQKWITEDKEREKAEKAQLTIAKFKILPNCVFRQSKPAIVGIEVLSGIMRTGCRLLTQDSKVVGKLKTMQLNKEDIKEARPGEKVAISIDDVAIGRQINENDVVYTFVSDDEIAGIKIDELSDQEKDVLQEILKIKKKK